MKGILILTIRYLLAQRLKTLIMIFCLSLNFFLPLSVKVLIDQYQKELLARAEATPLILGAKGNRYDLTFKTLYFSAEEPDNIKLKNVLEINDSEKAIAIPLNLKFSAQKFPVVGTTLDYFDFRKLKLRTGRLPVVLGETVVGSTVAQKLNLKLGAGILTDQTSFYDISAAYPLKLKVTGIMEPTNSPDDSAVIVDLKTAWIISGIGHGHQDLSKASPELILSKRKNEVVGNDAVIEYAEITTNNIESFHFHGDQNDFEITAAIVLPFSAKSATILKARYSNHKSIQLLDPKNVVAEVMGIVFQVKKFFDANIVLVSLSTLLLMTLIIILSLRIRSKEMQTMHRIGCDKLTIFKIQFSEIFLVVLISILIAIISTIILVKIFPQIMDLI